MHLQLEINGIDELWSFWLITPYWWLTRPWEFSFKPLHLCKTAMDMIRDPQIHSLSPSWWIFKAPPTKQRCYANHSVVTVRWVNVKSDDIATLKNVRNGTVLRALTRVQWPYSPCVSYVVWGEMWWSVLIILSCDGFPKPRNQTMVLLLFLRLSTNLPMPCILHTESENHEKLWFNFI